MPLSFAKIETVICYLVFQVLGKCSLVSGCQELVLVGEGVHIKGSAREFLCGDGTILNLACGGSYINLYMY